MSESPRYDLLLVVDPPGQRLAPRGGEALLRLMATERLLIPEAEAVADQWVEVYCRAGACAHDLFIKGAYEGEEPVFRQATVRFGTIPVDAPFGRESKETFFVDIRGCVFDDIGGRFRTRFQEMLHFRPTVFVRPADGLREHREVPEDERPKDRRRKRGGTGAQAGTRVEEW